MELQSIEFQHNQEINFNKINVLDNEEKNLRKIKTSNIQMKNADLNSSKINNLLITNVEKNKLDNFIKITNVNTYNTNNFSNSYNLETKENSFYHQGQNSINNSNIAATGSAIQSHAKVKSKQSNANMNSKSDYENGNKFPKNNNIILISKLLIIYEGKIKLFKKDVFIKELETNAIFGDISLGNNINENDGDIAVAEGLVKCYYINAKIFRENVDENYFNYIQSILVLQDTSVKLEDLFFIKNIGNGKYGKVFLVHNKKNLYALKTAMLSDIKKEKYLVWYYKNEKILMQQIDHPFVVKIVKTMKNFEMIFFLMEYIDGITLKFYLEKRGKNDNKSIEEAQFLGAILLIIVNYLHKKRIIHRDIKPDNIMLDQSVIHY